MKKKIGIVCIVLLQLIMSTSCDNNYDASISTKSTSMDNLLQFKAEGDSAILHFVTNKNGWWVSSYGTIINNDTILYKNGLQYDSPVPEGLTNMALDTVKGDFYTIIKRGLQKGTELFIQMDKNNSMYERNLYIYINRGTSGQQLIISQGQQGV